MSRDQIPQHLNQEMTAPQEDNPLKELQKDQGIDLTGLSLVQDITPEYINDINTICQLIN